MCVNLDHFLQHGQYKLFMIIFTSILQSTTPDHFDDETDYDLNTPQMHANLHSEFLQSVSNKCNTANKHKKGKFALASCNKRVIHENNRNNNSMLIENTKNGRLLSQNISRIRSKEPQKKCETSGTDKRMLCLENPRTRINGTLPLKVNQAKPCKNIDMNTYVPKPRRHISEMTSTSKRDKSKSSESPDIKSHPKSTLARPVSYRKSKEDKSEANDKSWDNSVTISSKVGNAQIDRFKHRKSSEPGHSKERRRSNLGNNQIMKTPTQPHANNKSRQREIPATSKQNKKEDPSMSRMYTIQEEEIRYDNQASKSSNGMDNATKTRLPLNTTTATSNNIFGDQSKTTHENNRPELCQLKKIETDFVAYLLPWLKLVPLAPMAPNKNVGGTLSKPKLEPLGNYLIGLSEVCSSYVR